MEKFFFKQWIECKEQVALDLAKGGYEVKKIMIEDKNDYTMTDDFVEKAIEFIKERTPMRYMVTLYLGRHEDQEMAGLILHLNDPRKNLTPRQILGKFKEDFTAAYLEECPPLRQCPSCKSKRRNLDGAGKFCANCGAEMVVTQRDTVESEEVKDFLIRNFIHATTDGLPCVDYLESHGWEIWGRKYKSDKIVFISGVNEFFEDEDSWYDEFGSIENW